MLKNFPYEHLASTQYQVLQANTIKAKVYKDSIIDDNYNFGRSLRLAKSIKQYQSCQKRIQQAKQPISNPFIFQLKSQMDSLGNKSQETIYNIRRKFRQENDSPKKFHFQKLIDEVKDKAKSSFQQRKKRNIKTVQNHSLQITHKGKLFPCKKTFRSRNPQTENNTTKQKSSIIGIVEKYHNNEKQQDLTSQEDRQHLISILQNVRENPIEIQKDRSLGKKLRDERNKLLKNNLKQVSKNQNIQTNQKRKIAYSTCHFFNHKKLENDDLFVNSQKKHSSKLKDQQNYKKAIHNIKYKNKIKTQEKDKITFHPEYLSPNAIRIQKSPNSFERLSNRKYFKVKYADKNHKKKLQKIVIKKINFQENSLGQCMSLLQI